MSGAPAAELSKAVDRIAGREVQALSGERAHASPHSSAAGARAAPGEDVRTYRGRTVEELIPRIQDELGADAIIVRRREGLTGGIAGFFQRPFIELEAIAGGARFEAYDEEEAVVPPLPPSPPSFPPHTSIPTPRGGRLTASPLPGPGAARERYSAAPALPVSGDSGGEPLRRRPAEGENPAMGVTEHLAALARAAPSRRTRQPTDAASYSQVFQELTPEDLGDSDSFSSVLDEAESRVLAEPTAAHAQAAPRVQTSTGPPQAASPAVRGRVRETVRGKLLGLGVSERFAEELIDGAAIHVLPLAPRAGLAQAAQSALAQRIPVCPPLPAAGAAIVLVGPGGVGKTSCCAALLSAYRKSALLPASCATLLRGPDSGDLQMLLSPHVTSPISIDTARAVRTLRKARGAGLLVIDTPPLSVGDRAGIRKLAGLLSVLEPERVLVALPATLGAVATGQLLHALRPLGANALAITHADETDQIGVAVEAACNFALAPEYLLDHGRRGARRLSRIDPSGVAARLMQ